MPWMRDCGLSPRPPGRTIRPPTGPADRGSKTTTETRTRAMSTAQFKPGSKSLLGGPLFILLTVACAQKAPEKNDAPAVPGNAAPAAPAKRPPQALTSVTPVTPDPLPFRAEESVSVRLQREIDTAARADPAGAAQMAAVHPVLTCVEKASAGEWRAHFGYRNKGSRELTIATGLHNRVWPPPIANGQPTAFAPGARAEAVELTFKDGGSVAWVLGQSFEVATGSSPRCGVHGAKRSAHAQEGHLPRHRLER